MTAVPPGSRHWLTGFLAGAFSTLVLVDFRRLEVWQQELVLIALALVIGWTLFESRREVAGARAEPEEKEPRDTVARPRAVALSHPVTDPPRPLPAPGPPELPSWKIESDDRQEIELPEEKLAPAPEDAFAEVPEDTVPFPEKLTEVWESYLFRGDGRFTAEGLRQFLSEAGLSGEILSGESLGAGEGLLAVDLGNGGDGLYLLPDFGKTIRSVAQWFHAPNTGSRLARISRLVEPAVVRRTAAGLEVKRHGVVE